MSRGVMNEAWLRHHFHSQYSGDDDGIDDPPLADTRPAEELDGQVAGEEADMMAGRPGHASRQAAKDRDMLERRYAGRMGGNGAFGGIEATKLQENMRVESRRSVETLSGTIPAGAKGVVTKLTESVATVNLGKHGVHELRRDVAANMFSPSRDFVSQTEVLRESFENSSPVMSLEPGNRCVDSRGIQYVVEGLAAHGYSAQVLGEDGKQHMAPVHTFTRIDAKAPFPIREGFVTEPMAPGSRVRVTNVDPVLNQFRSHAVGALETPSAYIGQIGILEFAYYPAGGIGGTRMYRVLFEKGGKRDFSEGELEVVPNGAM